MRLTAGTNAHRFKLAGQEEVAVEDFLEEQGTILPNMALGSHCVVAGVRATTRRPCLCVAGEQVDPAADDLRIQLFRQYLIAEEDEGFEGSFADFAGEDLAAELQLHEEDAEPEIEEVHRGPSTRRNISALAIADPFHALQAQSRCDEDAYLLAEVSSAEDSHRHFTALATGTMRCRICHRRAE